MGIFRITIGVENVAQRGVVRYVAAGGSATVDEVVFAEESDFTLLGVRTLEGLNLRIDVVSKQLVDAGPVPAAGASPNCRSGARYGISVVMPF